MIMFILDSFYHTVKFFFVNTNTRLGRSQQISQMHNFCVVFCSPATRQPDTTIRCRVYDVWVAGQSDAYLSLVENEEGVPSGPLSDDIFTLVEEVLIR